MNLKHRLRFCQPLDLYSGVFLPFSERTIEHVIPLNVLKRCHIRQALHDPLNLFVTEKGLNQYRADYRFGHKPWLRSTHPQRDDTAKVFFPIMNQRLLAHSILSMYKKYPRLETMHDEIFEHDEILDIWIRQAWTCTELKMLQWKWVIMGTE